MAIVAALVTSVLFCEIFACVVSQSGKPALIILPMLMMPVPLLLLRCCGGDDFMSSGPRGRHCACAPSLQTNKALSIPSSACTCMRCEESLLFSMLLTSSSLVFRAHVRRRLYRGRILVSLLLHKHPSNSDLLLRNRLCARSRVAGAVARRCAHCCPQRVGADRLVGARRGRQLFRVVMSS